MRSTISTSKLLVQTAAMYLLSTGSPHRTGQARSPFNQSQTVIWRRRGGGQSSVSLPSTEIGLNPCCRRLTTWLGVIQFILWYSQVRASRLNRFYFRFMIYVAFFVDIFGLNKAGWIKSIVTFSVSVSRPCSESCVAVCIRFTWGDYSIMHCRRQGPYHSSSTCKKVSGAEVSLARNGKLFLWPFLFKGEGT